MTVEGGHRIGLCGQAVLENETVIRTLKNIAFINIRVAHEIREQLTVSCQNYIRKENFRIP